MNITAAEAQKILRNAYLDIKQSLESDTVDLDLFELGALIGITLLKSSSANYNGPAQDSSKIEAQLADGLNAGLNMHAERFGIAFRDDMKLNCYGNLLN